MKNKKILFLPLDERPCNYELPYLLSKIAKGYQLLRPKKEILGNKKVPSNFSNVKDFLLTNAKESSYLVLSLDQLLYGGIVPSRIHNLSIKELKNRLEIIKDIKKENPNLVIYAFGLVLRCPCYNGSDEEPDYYTVCGEDIFNYGVLLSKKELSIIDENKFSELSKPLLEKIGDNLLDFETRRSKNREVLEVFIKEYSSLVDYIVIPQDDSEPFGYAMMDRTYIEKVLKEENVDAIMYPGADEVGMALLARVISTDLDFHPTITAIYPKEECKRITPLYEAQEVHLTLFKQLEVVGFNYNEKSENILFMNYPTKEMVNMGSVPSLGYNERDIKSFVNLIIQSINSGKKVAICDGAFLNGGEEAFLKKILEKTSAFNLLGYAGWNTSSNSLGTVLANFMFTLAFGVNEGHKKFISERIIEDIGYCGKVRWDIWHDYAPKHGYSLDDAGCRNGIVAKEIKKELNNYLEANFNEVYKRYKINKCQLPWSRLFEVDLSLARRTK